MGHPPSVDCPPTHPPVSLVADREGEEENEFAILLGRPTVNALR